MKDTRMEAAAFLSAKALSWPMISVWRHRKKNGQNNFFVYNGVNYPEMEESGWEMNYIRISFILDTIIDLRKTG